MNFQKFCAEILPHISLDGVPIHEFTDDFDNLEVLNAYGDWEDADYNLPDLDIENNSFRIKPKPDYRPFVKEDEEIFFGMKVYEKIGKEPFLITSCDDDGVSMPRGINTIYRTYEDLLEYYIFPHDIPCGVML